MVIRASREQEQEDTQKKYIHRERSYGAYTRRFDIDGIDIDAISAKYEDGLLKLTLPKQEKKVLEGKKISIG